MPTKTINCPIDFINLLEVQLHSKIWSQLEGSIISSVVPVKTSFISEALFQKTGKTPELIDESNCNINISEYKSKLGIDRVVCCASALSKYTPPILLIDLGTATTINFINSDGVFLGGAIHPGIQMCLSSLSEHTALLPQINCISKFNIIGKDTYENLISGAVIGTAGIIEGYLNRLELKLDSKPTVVITGGNAPYILEHCCFTFNYEPTLLIDGLFTLYKSLQRSKPHAN